MSRPHMSDPGARAGRFDNWLSGAILLVASLMGLAAFLYPFFMPAVVTTAGTMMAHASDAPLLTGVLVLLCLTAAFAGLGSQQMTSKMTAMLGILTALSAVLRALPGPGGFSAIFLLPILAGYAYGPVFGFLLGALSLLVSALIGGGVGPWLPYQMFAAAWVGLLSGWLPEAPRKARWEPWLLAVWGALLGLVFGAIMNLWFWPFLAPAGAGAASAASAGAGAAMVGQGGAGQGWQLGLAIWPAVRNYLAFYLATSLWWDVGRAGGNFVLLLALSRPVLRVLRRFRSRFRFDIVPVVQIDVDAP
jgi:energy-coupling factor transport system substrate-specific component